MPRTSKEIKGPGPERKRNDFPETNGAHSAAKMKQKADSRDHKRKKPPTDAATKQLSKKPRASEDAANSVRRKAVEDDQSLLLAEIRALGGDERDLDLINQVDSDDEHIASGSQRPIDERLKRELASLSKELGFDQINPEDASDIDVEDSQGLTNGQAKEVAKERKAGKGERGIEGEAKESSRKRKPGDMIYEPRAEWHSTQLASLPGPERDQVGPFMASLESLKKHARTLLDEDAAKYRTSIFASSSHKFLSTIMSSGTLSDKVSALTLAIQESPVHNIRAFEALLGLASKKGRAQAIGAIGALVDLLGPGSLLPPDRRLRFFKNQPGLLEALHRNGIWSPGEPLPGDVTEAHLIAWVYEDWLKENYFKLIQLLEAWCSDAIEYSRMKAVDFVYGLLKEKPEQESNLLKLLVNKLGDRDRKIASRASYLLLQLQISHPGMKPIIIRAIEQDILLHPAQDIRIKYCAVNTLNQTILNSKEPAVAESLLRIYFDLFVTLLKAGSLGVVAEPETGPPTSAGKQAIKPKGKVGTKDEKQVDRHASSDRPRKLSAPEVEATDKLVSALLTGVNRAAPFVETNSTIMDHHLDTLFKIAHSANFNTGVQALLLIQHLSSAKSLCSDRFYRTLYESLLDPRLVTSSKQALYLNLLLRALRSDVDVRRVKAFAKRMLQITGLHQPSFVCGLLYVVTQLGQAFPDLWTLVTEPEISVFDDESSMEQPRYDGRKRNPEHSNAHRSCLWEIIPIQAHYHPSVGVFAAALLEKKQKVQKPDLESHSLIRFLDKFVYKNPKATESTRGASIMQPMQAASDAAGGWLGGKGGMAAAPPVNSAAFWKKRADEVAAEDIFFHEYFHNVSVKEPKAKSAKVKASDAEQVEEGEDEDEDEVWKALVSTQADIGDAGSDAGFDDELDDAEMSSGDDGSSMGLSLDSEADEEEGGDDGLAAVDDEMDEEGPESAKKAKNSRRKALKDLPMFAAADDYAELLAREEDGR